jgi:hypothetical protein
VTRSREPGRLAGPVTESDRATTALPQAGRLPAAGLLR